MSTLTGTSLRPIDLGKPRMRGWLHAYASGVGVIAGIVLCAFAATRPGPALTTSLLYSATVVGMFGISALYHRRVWSPRMYPIMRRIDHAMIFVLIAATYTPFCVLLLPAAQSASVLTVVWAGALGGVALKVAWPHTPRWLSIPLYVALGWMSLAILPDIHRTGGTPVLALLAVGGAYYTLGAAFYAFRRPNPWPNVFGHHEFFHSCTVVAALCHYVAVYFAIFAATS